LNGKKNTMLRFLLVASQLALAASFAPQGLVAIPTHAQELSNLSPFSTGAALSGSLFQCPKPSHPSLRRGAPIALPISGILLRYPLFSAFIVCSFKASMADLLAQISDKTTSSFFSFRRNFSFLLYGGLYTGIAQELLYNGVYPFLFGHDTKFLTAAKKVLFDNFVVTPCLALPIAYIIKAPFTNKTFKEGFQNYINDVKYRGLLKQAWSIWIPVQFIVFTIIPPQFRVSFVACVSFFWIVLFSRITAKGEKSLKAA